LFSPTLRRRIPAANSSIPLEIQLDLGAYIGRKGKNNMHSDGGFETFWRDEKDWLVEVI
jgi:hypothetical protein